ncbi:MAG: permease prefix domain 1-containing protein, partial [Gammaproteobacteria bacterium]|nr:permease prefix domain 1-containing protein [Gammaproteobacteria bacterium]
MKVPGEKRYFSWPNFRWRAREELREELRFHYDNLVADLVTEGWTQADAEREARRRMGEEAVLHAAVDDIAVTQTVIRWVQDFGNDLKFAARLFLKTPEYFAVAVLTLGLGVGANLAVFNVFN